MCKFGVESTVMFLCVGGLMETEKLLKSLCKWCLGFVLVRKIDCYQYVWGED
jgi:hypothetical protein